MSWHAVDAVDDAVEATRRFLFPFSLVRWAKLAFLVLLMGGGVSTNASVPAVPNAELNVPPAGGPIGDTGPITGGTVDSGLALDGPLVVALLVGIVSAAVVLSVFSLSLRLVFYDALHANAVRLWRPFVARLRQAFGLFVASVVLSTVAALPIAVAVLVAGLSTDPSGWGLFDSAAASIASFSAGWLVALGILGAIVTLAAVLALRLTFEFVVPTMIVENRDVLAGWRRTWGSLRANRTDVVVYLVVHFVIGIGIAIAEGLAFALIGSLVALVAGSVLLIAAIPIGGIGALLETTAGFITVGIVAFLAVTALTALFLPVRVLTRTYLITYEVSTLAGIDRSLALLHPEIDPESTTVSDSSVPAKP
jgi:hypothetical protein